MSRTSISMPEREAPAWLHEKVYGPRRERTIDLAQRSIDDLVHHQRTVSLASVVATSKDVDPAGIGISEAALLNNADARAYYVQHRTWKGSASQPRTGQGTADEIEVHIKPNRDPRRARQRYMRLTKAELVRRLLAVEQAYADQRDLWLHANDELLTTRLQLREAGGPAEHH